MRRPLLTGSDRHSAMSGHRPQPVLLSTPAPSPPPNSFTPLPPAPVAPLTPVAPIAGPPPTVSPPAVAAPTAAVPSPVSTPAPTPTAAIPPTAFAPPPKRSRRRWLPIAGITLLVLLIIAGIVGWLHIRSVQANPNTVFKDALLASLSTSQLESQTSGGSGNSQVDFDFSDMKNPQVSSQSTIIRYGASFKVAAYGSTKNSYMSYTAFPAGVASNITTVSKDAWIQLRANGILPPGVPASLAELADPRYQAFGPLVFGNFPEANRAKLVDYLLKQHIYKYQLTKVTHTKLGDTKVYAYPVSLNLGFLKVFIQSAANSEGFTPSDVQAAINDLDALKNASATIYVSDSGHHIVQLDVNQSGQTTSTSYHYKAAVAAEPQTKLKWQDFASVQLQIDQQMAKLQSPAELDAERKADLTVLHDYLADYFTQNTYYPTFGNLNDPNWVATNLPGINPAVFRDPLGANSQLLAQPKAGNFAYQVASATAKACDNNPAAAISQLCSIYSLTTVLSDGKQYSVQNP